MNAPDNRYSLATARFCLVSNVLALLVVSYAAILHGTAPELYYTAVQEDQYIEWASFWAFLFAAAINGLAARRYRSMTQRLPWFLFGVALFCFVVAMEEISWGQRLLGYRPPAYFLEQNFQQELNLHNVIGTDYRKLLLQLIVASYGMVLPVAGFLRKTSVVLDSAGIPAPAIGLAPIFAVALMFYLWYPLSYSGEWVEMLMAFGFLFAAIDLARRFSLATDTGFLWIAANGTQLIVAVVTILGLGFASAALSRIQQDTDPSLLRAAETEIDALKIDFESGMVRSDCNLHKRVFTFVEEYGEDYFYQGEFNALQAQGLPADRARYFIDPWNSPYWIRDRCDDMINRRVQFVYSFGPNRRRESTRFDILGDDIGAYFISEEDVPGLP